MGRCTKEKGKELKEEVERSGKAWKDERKTGGGRKRKEGVKQEVVEEVAESSHQALEVTRLVLRAPFTWTITHLPDW